ncbi:site-specific integrase [Flagellimonas amoyensis]|uniref:site-specific integrase n=1 Tax=Flagellimonas amoyensis TaxID=2169401 RepID=UPI00131F00BA|nr:site-specific integrase [Allomuricauda amoyensis]
MNCSNSFSIGYWLKKTAKKGDGLIPIYARIRFEGRYCDLSVHRSTLEERWCPKLGRMDHRSSEANSTNKYLDEVRAKLLDCHRQLFSEGLPISPNAIKQRYLGKDKKILTLEDIFEYHRTHEIPKLAPGTTKNYGATETYLKRFIKKRFHAKDIRLSFIDYSFVVEFESFLRTCNPINKHQPLTNNGIMKHLERFKKFVGIAYKLRCLPIDPFLQYRLKYEDYDSDFLEDWELEVLFSLAIPEKGIDIVKDIFLFACYTGLSYIEVKLLKIKDIVIGVDGEQWINVKRKKTKTPLKVPLLARAKDILEKYALHPDIHNDQSLLPVFSNQKVNKYLKIIGQRANIGKHLTFHVARHTFATTITLMNNVPIETVAKLLGHNKLSTTQKYARVVEKKISKDMKALKQVLEEQSETRSTKSKDRESVQERGHLSVVR